MAQLKPIPSSQETSTIRLPGTERGQVVGLEEGQRLGGVLQRAVDDDVALGEERCQRDPAPSVMTWLGRGPSVSWSICLIRAEWIGEPTAATPRLVSTCDVVHAVRLERRHRAARSRAEADHDGVQAAGRSHR